MRERIVAHMAAGNGPLRAVDRRLNRAAARRYAARFSACRARR